MRGKGKEVQSSTPEPHFNKVVRKVNGPTFIHMFKEPKNDELKFKGPFLNIVFPLEGVTVPFKYRASVEQLLAHLFDSETVGSVKAKLLDMGLISDMVVIMDPQVSFFTSLTIRLNLMDTSQIEVIVQEILKYIAVVQQSFRVTASLDASAGSTAVSDETNLPPEMKSPVSELYEELYRRSIFRWQYEKTSADDTGMLAGEIVEHLTHGKMEDWDEAYEYVFSADKLRPWEVVKDTIESIIFGIGLKSPATASSSASVEQPANHFFVVLQENNPLYEFYAARDARLYFDISHGIHNPPVVPHFEAKYRAM